MNDAPTAPMDSEADRRRSRRLLLRVEVAVRGTSSKGAEFEEESHTLVVNAHGGVLTLSAPVEMGQRLTLRNRNTEKEMECIVVFLGPSHAGKAQVGFEFFRPAPHFWQISFPPPDWQPAA